MTQFNKKIWDNGGIMGNNGINCIVYPLCEEKTTTKQT